MPLLLLYRSRGRERVVFGLRPSAWVPPMTLSPSPPVQIYYFSLFCNFYFLYGYSGTHVPLFTLCAHTSYICAKILFSLYDIYTVSISPIFALKLHIFHTYMSLKIYPVDRYYTLYRPFFIMAWMIKNILPCLPADEGHPKL